MYIKQVYKYQLNGITYVSSNVPEGAEISETMNILNAESGYELVRKSDEENVGNSVWLKDGDTEENYTEIEAPKDDENPSD